MKTEIVKLKCEWCNGKGSRANWNHGQPEVEPCEKCDGKGYTEFERTKSS